MTSKRIRGFAGLALSVAFGCSGAMTTGPEPSSSPKAAARPRSAAGPGAASPPSKAASLTPEGNRDAAAIAAKYAAYVDKHRDATYEKLSAELRVVPLADHPLSFDPNSAQHFPRIAQELQLTTEERQIYQRQGMVNVDHQQRYSMGSAYFAIYARDLPVLITTDSILHALHRSYDEILKRLELDFFALTIDETLRNAHDTLAKRAPELKAPSLVDSANDIDVYLTVAQRLLHGDGAAAGEPAAAPDDEGTPPAVASRLGNDAQVAQLLANIASLKLQSPEMPTRIYGGARAIDYSQYRPRGHYTESALLKRYFRAMMWLGRADTAFIIAQPDARASLDVNPMREARDAALFTTLLSESGGVKSLGMLRALIDFMVGRADNATLENMQAALNANGVSRYADLADDAVVTKLRASIGTLATQHIRSQVVTSPVDDPRQVPTPQTFQLFGQRFVLDSFVLANVVYDSISFRGRKEERMMPAGLDVMAALGSDEAVRLLKPAIDVHHYAANLLALRKTIDERPAASWRADLYSMWLDALREIDDSEVGEFPQVMRRGAWRRKQLQTQLASWAELRHDTILYAKQSYTAWPSCGYPAAFVEPYPEFYEKLQSFAERGADLLQAAELKLSDPTLDQRVQRTRSGQVKFLRGFAQTMELLGVLAKKELAAKPFTQQEEDFLRRTLDVSGGGSGPPRYNGWYPKLLYAGAPDAWKPSVADVHTNPKEHEVLEEAVGDVNFLVVAIDNQGDRAAYVGPVYSYYEFKRPASQRMTDEEWQERIRRGSQPERPAFTLPFRAKPQARHLGPPQPRALGDDPRLDRIAELYEQFSSASSERRQQLHKELTKLVDELENPPNPLEKSKP